MSSRILKYITCFSLIIALALGSFQRVYADTNFTDFTDVDPDQLIDITSSYDIDDLIVNVSHDFVIDSAVSYAFQQNFEVSGSHTIAFTGSYYDNTITSMTACSSSSYQYNTQSHTIDGVMITEPTLFGSIGYQNQSAFLNVAMNVSVQSSASGTVTTNSFSNESQACALLGMNDGDGAIDGTILLDAGYIKKTISYNDGSSTPHTATFYVPGPEDLNFETDDLQELIDAIYVQVLNNISIDYHYEWSISMTMARKVMPSYGYINSDVWLPRIFGGIDLYRDDSLEKYKWYALESDHTSYNSPTSFIDTILDNKYYSYTQLWWSDTTFPIWRFRTPEFKYNASLNSSAGMNNTVLPFDVGGSSMYSFSVGSDPLVSTVNQDMKNYQTSYDLTIGAGIPYGTRIKSFKFYKLQDTSRLNLFNQLGSFLNTQFNRVVNTIANISGGSNDLADDISQDYNIDIDVSINNDIDNLYDRDDDIDLTLPEYNLDSNNNLSLLRDVPLETVNLFFDNKLGYLILLPIIIAIIGRVIG